VTVNRHQPHVQIVPEDGANRQIAKGFESHQSVRESKLQVLPEARGWGRVLGDFESIHTNELRRFPSRYLILIIDFDNDSGRLALFQSRTPPDLQDRVFVLGTWSEPERLKKDLGSFETMGRLLAEDCLRHTDTTWAHPPLEHNKGELARLREQVRPFLFEEEN